MQIEAIKLDHKPPLLIDYLNQDERLKDFVDYPTINLTQRIQDLQEQSFNREALTRVLTSMNKNWQAPRRTMENIKRLQEANSVVVIGGQQAGLLTGPLYTLNKVISLIQYSKMKEQKLNIPVIPVFWIAGEDHDFAEINHINILQGTRLKKETISQLVPEGSPVSDISIDHKRTKQWLNKLFLTLPETIHTKKTYEAIINCLQSSTTYVDFFARLIYLLFPDEGIVLINSQDEQLRKIEAEHFVTMIEKQEEITAAIYETDVRLKRLGYSISVQVAQDDAHLFYHLKGRRVLLQRTQGGQWTSRQGEVEFTTDELIQIAQKHPELLSNNVMTRPIMQEFLFPTLAFIGGHAEIGYWMLLKEALQIVQKKLPPLVPRLSLTYINRKLEKILKSYHLAAEDVINNGTHKDKLNFLASYQEPALKQMFEQYHETLKYIHQPIRDAAYNIRSDVGQFADRNLFHLQSTVNNLQQRMEKSLEQKYEQVIKDFDLLQCYLQPENGLQERLWSILPLLNDHGITFVKTLINEPLSFKEDHFAIYL